MAVLGGFVFVGADFVAANRVCFDLFQIFKVMVV